MNSVLAPQGDPTPVIIDDGTVVRVVLVRFQAPPEVGDLFTFEGTMLEVVRAKDHARGFVARPVSNRAS
ncbi:MAG TPA: hypothetical protein VMT45_13850 [Thermoanaerobaculaceae bacterium]|nr:hypothetical protein [Thermoanaerobaculaceae bacterium]